MAFGDRREMVCAFINIDMGSVGNWAERRNIAYSGYTDLAQRGGVPLISASAWKKADARTVARAMVCDSQVHRFLILHKELDPDDDELTRTRKVRRGFIAQKYQVLIDALYSGKASQFIETQVKFEDGRSGKISADLRIAEAKTLSAAGRSKKAA